MNTQMDDTGPGAARRQVMVPLAEIDEGERLRPTDPEKVEQVRRSMAQIGLRSPIEVRAKPGGGWLLVAGAHRLAAARALGFAEIEALVFEGDDDEARLAEIDENLVRHELTPFDQAVFLAERAAIYRRMNPETGKGRAPKPKKNNDQGKDRQVGSLSSPRAFAEDVAEKIGFSPRTVWRALTRFEKLSPEARDMVRGSEIAANGAALDALLKVPAARQARVAREALTRDVNAPLAERMAAAKERVLGVRRPVPDRVAAAKAAYDRLGPEERTAFVDWLRKTGQIGRRAAPAGADGE